MKMMVLFLYNQKGIGFKVWSLYKNSNKSFELFYKVLLSFSTKLNENHHPKFVSLKSTK